MPNATTGLRPAVGFLDEEFLRALAAVVRAERRCPRRFGLHTSDMVSATVYRLLAVTEPLRPPISREGYLQLARRIARGVVVDCFRAIDRTVRQTRPLDRTTALAAPTPEIGPDESDLDFPVTHWRVRWFLG